MSSVCKIEDEGQICWYDEKGNLHREDDLPAIIYSGGSQVWCKHGLRHREGDLPAVIDSNGYQYWYKEGWQYKSRHRK